MSKIISNITFSLILLISSTVSHAAVNFEKYKDYEDCSGDDAWIKGTFLNSRMHKTLENISSFKNNGYDYEMIMYDADERTPEGIPKDGECVVVDNKLHVVMAYDQGRSNFCNGQWDSTKNTPIWISYNQDKGNENGIATNFSLRKMSNCKIQFSKENISQLNNQAYFIQQSGNNVEAIKLLKKVLEVAPQRTVAYLNMADSYLALGKKDLANQNYKKYIQLMRTNKQESKIPQRVLDAVK